MSDKQPTERDKHHGRTRTRDESATAEKAEQGSTTDPADTIGADHDRGWAGISSYADTEGFIADDLRAERFRRRNLLRQERATQGEPVAISWHWKDLFRTVNDARATIVVAVGVLAIVVGLTAFATGLGARGAANDFRDAADKRIAELEAELNAARADLAAASADADSVAPAVTMSHFTVAVAGSGDDARISRVGLWNTSGAEDADGTMQGLIAVMGAPDKARPVDGDAARCRATWTEPGIAATFEIDPSIPVGVFDPSACQTPEATRPVSIQLTGDAWQTNEGVGIGDSAADVEERYPDAEPTKGRYHVASRYSFAESRAVPVLTIATGEDDTVTALLANFSE